MSTTVQATRTRSRWDRADHDQRRELVIDAALNLLKRRGLSAVTMRNVARRLGVGAMTLYTYVDGQDELRRAMAHRGFEMLSAGCDAASTLDSEGSWRGGSRFYVQFALDNPNLYELMFAVPIARGGPDATILMGGFRPLLDKVRERLAAQGLSKRKLDRAALDSAGRFWIALHGLASLAIAQRLSVLDRDVESLMDDLLERVAPR